MIFSGYLDEDLPKEERTSVYEAVRCCFFDSLETKSIDELRALSTKYGENVVNYLAQSYTDEGSTPLLLAIRYERLDLVKFLMEELEARLNQTGRFVWEEEEYEDVPPLFAAVISGQLSITKYLTSTSLFLVRANCTFRASQLLKIVRTKSRCLNLWGPLTFW